MKKNRWISFGGLITGIMNTIATLLIIMVGTLTFKIFLCIGFAILGFNLFESKRI